MNTIKQELYTCMLTSILCFYLICTYMCFNNTLKRHGVWGKFNLKTFVVKTWIHILSIISVQTVICYIILNI